MNYYLSRNFITKSVHFFKQHCFSTGVQQTNLILGEEIAIAKEKDLPIVALESTIISHGMPYPDNLNTALEVEEIIRKKNVTPATIAILNGKIKVGVTHKELEELANSNDKNVIKVSRRDFSYAISQNLTGGTTVSGTMLVAEKAGISIMATGGIGGVHREFESSLDVSADLKELGQTQVAVVCSGVKAILDIPKTLEYLESEGVPVATVGDTNKFPAFYCRETFDGLQSPMRVLDAEEASRLILAQKQLGLKTGILLAVPIPRQFSLDPHDVEFAIKEALQAAKKLNITGKYVTPFLLEKLSTLTAGQSLQANKSLIKNNAEVAAEIALHLNLKTNIINESSDSSAFISNYDTKINKGPSVIGGATYDTVLRISEPEIMFNGSTHKGESQKSCGGVGRNLTNALINLGMKNTKLFSVVGTDEAGKTVVNTIDSAATTVKKLSSIKTANYTAIVDNKGSCCFGIGEMEAFNKIDQQLLQSNIVTLKNSSFLVLDGNPPLDTMNLSIEVSKKEKIPLWYEPTDLHKALKIFKCGNGWKNVLNFISPNLNELLAIAEYFKIQAPPKNSEIDLKIIKKIAEQLVELVPVVITTLGARGVLVARKSSENEPFLDEHNTLVETTNINSRLYPTPHLDKKIVSVSGCGDCLAAGIITGVLKGWEESSCITLGLYAAKQSLFSFKTVPNSLKSLPTSQDFYKSNLLEIVR